MERSLIEATSTISMEQAPRGGRVGISLKTLYNKLNGYSQSQCASS